MGAQYTSQQFHIWAVINNTVCDLVQFQCSYEMNTIPTCTAMLPVGYRVLPNYDASPAHQITTGVTVQIPMTVYCSIFQLGGDVTLSMPLSGVYTLFDGYVTGVGYRRTYDGYSMTIEGTHWLSNLSYSSILSATSNPNNPTMFTFPASFQSGGGARVGNVQCGLPSCLMMPFVNAANVTQDLWGQVILPMFQSLTTMNRMNLLVWLAMGQDPKNDTPNKDVANALAKFDGTKLPFVADKFATGAATAAMMIGKQLSMVLVPTTAAVDSLARQTVWDKLVGELAPTYMFQVIPFPTHAQVVPFIPGLRAVYDPNGEGWTFRARDIEVQDMNCALPRFLRAVGIFSGYGSRSGANLNHDTMNNFRIGGMYAAPNAKAGMVIMREAPSFLWDAAIPSMFAAQALAVHGRACDHPAAGGPGGWVPNWLIGAGNRVLGMLAPQPGQPGYVPGGGPALNPANIKQDVLSLLDLIAHATYVNEVLKNRYGDISTCLRFDVCPGSSVKIEGTAGQFGAPNGEDRYGQVMRVTYMFDAQQQKCGTNYRIGWMHTAGEHNLDQFTINAHPLYKTTFTGDKLVVFAPGVNPI